jgi:hypothetical protein
MDLYAKKTSLHDELIGLNDHSCKVCVFLSQLSPDLEEEWVRELALPVKEIGNTAIVRALARRGIQIDETSVRRHRRNHYGK